MSSISIVCVFLATLSVALIVRSWKLVKSRQWMGSGFYAVPALFTLISLFFLLLVVSNLTTYQRLTYEHELLQLSIGQIAGQQYEVRLDYLDSDLDRLSNVLLIKGDEWRLEARILKWQGWANVIGLDSFYQLDRLSGRYRNIEQAGSQLPTVHNLSNNRGINLWQMKHLMKSNLPFLDAYYGQAVFLPLQHDAVFRISINQSGLIARPANDIAKQALEYW